MAESPLARIRELPILRMSPEEFFALSDYSASLPTGQSHLKRWRRLDGSFDPRCTNPVWMVGQYRLYAKKGDIVRNWLDQPLSWKDNEAKCKRYEDAGWTVMVATEWFRPVLTVRAETQAPRPWGEILLAREIEARMGAA